MSIKTKLKKNALTKGLYASLKAKKDKRVYNNKFKYHGKFIDRSSGTEFACIVLAGYKDYLYPAVFGRLKKYAPKDMDICIVTSGKFCDKVNAICEENNWSYLSTEENNVCLVQNVAIDLHPKAKYIFKLDEDIFITEGFFEGLKRAYNHAEDGLYFPGVVAPLIPINGYGHVRVLDKLGLTEEYEKRFGHVKFAAGHNRPIESSSEVAKFFWGEDDVIPSIDEMNRRFANEPIDERAVPFRFSIGAILLDRTVWEDMGFFPVDRDSVSLGTDEVELCSFCCLKSRPLIVSENVLVGHFSFGPQNAIMKEYYEQHEERFLI